MNRRLTWRSRFWNDLWWNEVGGVYTGGKGWSRVTCVGILVLLWTLEELWASAEVWAGIG